MYHKNLYLKMSFAFMTSTNKPINGSGCNKTIKIGIRMEVITIFPSGIIAYGTEDKERMC